MIANKLNNIHLFEHISGYIESVFTIGVFMLRTVLSILLIVCMGSYVAWEIYDGRFSKDRMIERASVIGLAQIQSVNCPVDGNCKSYTMVVSPVELIKGDLPVASTVYMRKG